MKLTKQIEEARALLDDAIEKMDEQDARIQALPSDTPTDVRQRESDLFDNSVRYTENRRESLERLIAIERARQNIPPLQADLEPGNGVPRVKTEEPHTYRRDNANKVSFFSDLVTARKGDTQAAERLNKHAMETRDVSTADPGAGVFVPPVYLDELWAEFPREGRPFADALPTLPLPDTGMSITVPRVTTATTVAVQQTEASAVSETDIDGTLLTVNVRTIAGQNDVSLQALERTMPGMDFLIFRDLTEDYDEQLDSQLLNGTGSNGQHLGIRAVSSINTVTYTDATPTAAEFYPKLGDAIQQIRTGRNRFADLIVMTPKRAAWLGTNLSSTFPLFQLGSLMQAAGTQNRGFVDNIGGLRVIIDANISSEFGASTDEDEVYVVYSGDLYLMEGPLRVRVFDDVLSGTLQVRLQVVAYSAFISGRQPESIAKIGGTGLKGGGTF